MKRRHLRSALHAAAQVPPNRTIKDQVLPDLSLVQSPLYRSVHLVESRISLKKKEFP